MIRRAVILGIVLALGVSSAAEAKRKKKPPEEQTKQEPAKEEPAKEEPAAEQGPSKEELEAKRREDEQKRVEAAKKKLELEARKGSKITPGTASRWSNKGALQPIESEVPLTVPLPQRAVPLAAGQETPGQSLIGREELLQARFFLSFNHFQTRGQDFVFEQTPANGAYLLDQDNNIDLYRGRATIAYERIAGSDIGAHFDLEYRGRSNGPRRTDHRINELYVSYGLTDFTRSDPMTFGIAAGRVAVREAGYAQTDGLLLRLKFTDELKLGAFGGVTGNPFGYNWAARQTQEFSADWLRAGAFAGYREGRFFLNAAGVATIARLGGQPNPSDPTTFASSGLDRLYLYLDTAYLLTESVNVFIVGWFDIIGGSLFQNVDAVVAWAPTNDLELRLGGGRFSTAVYDVSSVYSFSIDKDSNKVGDLGLVVVDENGQPIVPFDAIRGVVTYNTARARVGYRIVRPLELFASTEMLIRDTSDIDEKDQAVAGAILNVQKFRLLPSAGARFHDPALLDAAIEATYILDKESNANGLIQVSIGRQFFGMFASADARGYFGKIAGADGGVEVGYQFPREWFLGRLMLRGMLRYYRESVAITRPETLDGQVKPDALFTIPLQETYLGFASIEYRL